MVQNYVSTDLCIYNNFMFVPKYAPVFMIQMLQIFIFEPWLAIFQRDLKIQVFMSILNVGLYSFITFTEIFMYEVVEYAAQLFRTGTSTILTIRSGVLTQWSSKPFQRV